MRTINKYRTGNRAGNLISSVIRLTVMLTALPVTLLILLSGNAAAQQTTAHNLHIIPDPTQTTVGGITFYNHNQTQSTFLNPDTTGSYLGTPALQLYGMEIPQNGPGWWLFGNAYILGQTIIDPAHHLQVASTAGIAGFSQPSFNDSGGTTADGTVVWTDHGTTTLTANGGYIDIQPLLYNPNQSSPTTVCLDTLGSNPVTQPIPANGQSSFSINDALLWVGPSPVAPAVWAARTYYPLQFYITDPAGHRQVTTTGGLSGSSIPAFNDAGGNTSDGSAVWHDTGFTGCVPPVSVNEISGLNLSTYLFALGGIATSNVSYESIQTYGGMVANSLTMGVLYPSGTITTTGTTTFPEYLGGHIDVGHSAGPPASAMTTSSITGGVSTSFTVNNAAGLAAGSQIVFEDSSPETVTVAGSYTAGSLTVPITAAAAHSHPSSTFVAWCCGQFPAISYVTNPFSYSEGLVQGQLYWDDTLGCLRVYSGTQWNCLGTGTSVPSGTNEITFNNGSGGLNVSSNLFYTPSSSQLTVLSTGSSSGVISPLFNSSATGSSVAFQLSSGYAINANGTAGMLSLAWGNNGTGGANGSILNSAGALGVGTITPGVQLDVVGTVRASTQVLAPTVQGTATGTTLVWQGNGGTSTINGNGAAAFQSMALGLQGSPITGSSSPPNALISATSSGLFLSLSGGTPVPFTSTAAGSSAGEIQYTNGSGAFQATTDLKYVSNVLTLAGSSVGVAAPLFNSSCSSGPGFQLASAGYEWTCAGDLGVHSLSVNTSAASISSGGAALFSTAGIGGALTSGFQFSVTGSEQVSVLLSGNSIQNNAGSFTVSPTGTAAMQIAELGNQSGAVTGSSTLALLSATATGLFVSLNGGTPINLTASGGGVSSFNTRTGAVTLTAADVTSAVQALLTTSTPTFLNVTASGSLADFAALDRTGSGAMVMFRTGGVNALADSTFGNALTFGSSGVITIPAGLGVGGALTGGAVLSAAGGFAATGVINGAASSGNAFQTGTSTFTVTPAGAVSANSVTIGSGTLNFSAGSFAATSLQHLGVVAGSHQFSSGTVSFSSGLSSIGAITANVIQGTNTTETAAVISSGGTITIYSSNPSSTSFVSVIVVGTP